MVKSFPAIMSWRLNVSNKWGAKLRSQSRISDWLTQSILSIWLAEKFVNSQRQYRLPLERHFQFRGQEDVVVFLKLRVLFG